MPRRLRRDRNRGQQQDQQQDQQQQQQHEQQPHEQQRHQQQHHQQQHHQQYQQQHTTVGYNVGESHLSYSGMRVMGADPAVRHNVGPDVGFGQPHHMQGAVAYPSTSSTTFASPAHYTNRLRSTDPYPHIASYGDEGNSQHDVRFPSTSTTAPNYPPVMAGAMMGSMMPMAHRTDDLVRMQQLQYYTQQEQQGQRFRHPRQPPAAPASTIDDETVNSSASVPYPPPGFFPPRSSSLLHPRDASLYETGGWGQVESTTSPTGWVRPSAPFGTVYPGSNPESGTQHDVLSPPPPGLSPSRARMLIHPLTNQTAESVPATPPTRTRNTESTVNMQQQLETRSVSENAEEFAVSMLTSLRQKQQQHPSATSMVGTSSDSTSILSQPIIPSPGKDTTTQQDNDPAFSPPVAPTRGQALSTSHRGRSSRGSKKRAAVPRAHQDGTARATGMGTRRQDADEDTDVDSFNTALFSERSGSRSSDVGSGTSSTGTISKTVSKDDSFDSPQQKPADARAGISPSPSKARASALKRSSKNWTRDAAPAPDAAAAAAASSSIRPSTSLRRTSNNAATKPTAGTGRKRVHFLSTKHGGTGGSVTTRSMKSSRNRRTSTIAVTMFESPWTWEEVQSKMWMTHNDIVRTFRDMDHLMTQRKQSHPRFVEDIATIFSNCCTSKKKSNDDRTDDKQGGQHEQQGQQASEKVNMTQLFQTYKERILYSPANSVTCHGYEDDDHTLRGLERRCHKVLSTYRKYHVRNFLKRYAIVKREVRLRQKNLHRASMGEGTSRRRSSKMSTIASKNRVMQQQRSQSAVAGTSGSGQTQQGSPKSLSEVGEAQQKMAPDSFSAEDGRRNLLGENEVPAAKGSALPQQQHRGSDDIAVSQRRRAKMGEKGIGMRIGDPAEQRLLTEQWTVLKKISISTSRVSRLFALLLGHGDYCQVADMLREELQEQKAQDDEEEKQERERQRRRPPTPQRQEPHQQQRQQEQEEEQQQKRRRGTTDQSKPNEVVTGTQESSSSSSSPSAKRQKTSATEDGGSAVTSGTRRPPTPF